MDLQAILNSVMRESGMSTPTAYASSTDDAVLRMVDLANRSLVNLTRYPWQALRATHEFTLTTDTQYPLPDDYRAVVPDTFFTDSRMQPVDFPANATEWGYLQSNSGGAGSQVRVRLLGDYIEIYQPDSGDTLRFEYLTNSPVLSAEAIRKSRFTADTDTCLLDDDLLIMDIIWRYKKLMGLTDWQVDLAECKSYENTLKGQDSGSQTIMPGEVESTGPYYDLWRPVPNV